MYQPPHEPRSSDIWDTSISNPMRRSDDILSTVRHPKVIYKQLIYFMSQYVTDLNYESPLFYLNFLHSSYQLSWRF